MGAGNVARALERFPPLDFHPSPSMMASRFAADEAIRRNLPPRVRPSRWAYRLDGLEFSRRDLLAAWRRMKEPTAKDLAPGRVYFHEGHGCTTSAKRGNREGREVLTLRDLLKVARLDYVAPKARA